MINNGLYNIPTDWLVWSWDLDWDWKDRSWNSYDLATSNIVWEDTNLWFNKQKAKANWINSKLYNTSDFNLWWTDEFTIIMYLNLTYQWATSYISWNYNTSVWQVSLAIIKDWNWTSVQNGKIHIQRGTNWWGGIFLNWDYPENTDFILKITNTSSWLFSFYIDDVLQDSWINATWTSLPWLHLMYATNDTNWVLWNISLIKLYNKVITSSENFALKAEWLKKFWPWPLQQYPELFEWVVWYWNFRNWNLSNLIDWVNATNNWSTSATDHLGNSDSARSFDWVDDYISMPSWTSISWSNPRTLNCWIKKTSSTTIKTIYESWVHALNQVFRLHTSVATANDVYIAFSNNDYYTPWSVISNWSWHNITVVYDWWTLSTSTVHIYIDWVNQSLTKSWTWTWSANTAVWTSYWGQDTSIRYFDWIIDNGIIHNKALSSDEVKLLYELTKKKYIYPLAKYTPPSLPKPVLHIDWNNNWTTWYDSSWNSNNWTGTAIAMSRINQSNVMGFNGSSSKIDLWDLYSYFINNVSVSIKVKISNSCIYATFWYWYMWYNASTNNIYAEYWWWSDISVSHIKDITNKIVTITWTRSSTWTGWRLYIDWNFVATNNNTTNMANRDTYWLWYYRASINQFLSWNIIECKVWNEVLTDEQIQQDYYWTYIK